MNLLQQIKTTYGQDVCFNKSSVFTKGLEEKLQYLHCYVEPRIDEILIDCFLAAKEFPLKNTRYLLMLTVSLNKEKDTPEVYLMLIEQDIEGNEEAHNEISMSIPMDTVGLPQIIHECIKQSGVSFDTAKYCEELMKFLKVLKVLKDFDKELFDYDDAIFETDESELTSYGVLYSTEEMRKDSCITVPSCYLLKTINSEYAESIVENVIKNADITWVTESDNEEQAFKIYHQESIMEEC